MNRSAIRRTRAVSHRYPDSGIRRTAPPSLQLSLPSALPVRLPAIRSSNYVGAHVSSALAPTVYNQDDDICVVWDHRKTAHYVDFGQRYSL